MTPAQACEFLQCSRRTLDRMLADGTIRYVKLGKAKSAGIRIVDPMADLGLVSERKQARDRKQAESEYVACMAALRGER